MYARTLIALAITSVATSSVLADGHGSADDHGSAPDQQIAHQRQQLAESTQGQGFGPQSPRDIEAKEGRNQVIFNGAPDYHQMNLCNIHFHKNAEHKGGEFTHYAGNGDGHGYQSGYQYTGSLTSAEMSPLANEVCPSSHGSLHPGDTIETHYVHSSAQIQPGPTLSSCFNDSIKNPQLRVVAQVYVLVNDDKAEDFATLAHYEQQNGFYQAVNIPTNLGAPVHYSGSTTGPGYNEKGSPYQVSWSVHPKVAKVNIQSVGEWCKENTFDEDHAHGVRNLVTNLDLLSEIP